jgi:ATP-binding cassette, subfamily B, bacterial
MMTETDIEFREEEFSSRFSGRTVLRILGLARPHWRWLVGFMVFIAIVSAADSVFTYLSKLIIDDGIVARDEGRLMELLRVYGGLAMVQAVAVLGFIYLTGILGERINYDLRKGMFGQLQELSFSYFDRTPVGWIMSRVTSDATKMADLVTWGLLDVTWALMNIATAIYFMVIINWRLALVVLAVMPVMLVVAVQFQKRIIVQYRKVRKQNSKLTGAYNENITGVRVVKALRREEQNLSEFGEQSGQMYRAAYRAAWWSALFLPAVQIIGSLALGAVVWYGGWQTQAGTMTIGGIQAFVSYIAFMLWPIQDMARVYASMQDAIASAERVFSLLDAEPEVADREGAIDPGSVRGEIAFEDVGFHYEEGKPVLSGFNLTVREGETIALVGPTGGGKSTIINLLCRFYEPTGGVIRMAGRDYTELTLAAIQSRIGMVLQTPHLFSGTVRDNIRYGRLEATDEEVEEAARIARAHDFIVEMEDGYDEQVGEGGGRLAVGQKQLISLARAVLSDPEIFIMDEATSSVDTMNEALIQQGMDAVMEGRTSFVIAHRLSTIRRADRILVIEEGQITEEGTHADLMRARGHYYSLYTQQFRQEKDEERRRKLELLSEGEEGESLAQVALATG